MTRRVIYSTSGLQEWVDLALRFHSVHGWEPCYWIAPWQIEEHVRQAFPDAVVHAFLDAAVGLPPLEFCDLRFRALDGADLTRFRRCETPALQIMDRMDSGNNAFTYSERRRFFLQQVMYWLNVVEKAAPDLVFFTESPHSAAQFILYALCTEKSIPTVMFAPLAPFSRVYVRARIEDLPLTLDAEYTRAVEAALDERLTLAPDIEEQVRRIGGDYSEAEPWYMRRQREAPPNRRGGGVALLPKLLRVDRWPAYAMNLISRRLTPRPVTRNYLKLPGIPVEASRMSPQQMAAYRRRASEFKSVLKTRYASVAGAPVPGKKYVYVPLHYQPERTSVPEGGEFGDQWLLVNLLAQALPEGWYVYVKEHVSQFSDKLQGHQGRTLDYYDELLRLKNVRLIDLSADPFGLIDKAQAVATLTGTAGLEGLLRGTPVLVFGEAWYRACEGAFTVRSLQNCRQALDTIQQGYAIDQAKVRAYLKAMERLSVPAFLNPSTSKGASFSAEENADSLIQALESYLKAAGLDHASG